MRMMICFALMLLIFSRNKQAAKKIEISGFAQGTTYHITYYANDSIVTKQQTDSLLNALDSSLSIYKTYSVISRFNASDSGIAIDEHLYAVVQKSLETYYATNGLFDITVLPLVEAWGFGTNKIANLPTASQIKQLKNCVSSHYLQLNNHFLHKAKPCVHIDVNGIAQGYSVDVMAAFLEKNNLTNYVAEIGGEIRVNGKKPNGEMMKIGIEAPAADNETEPELIQQVIETGKGGITTSGNYRKFYESGGKRITHIINPASGYPVNNEIISVTVYAKDAITADAFDNALMLMGVTKALQFVHARRDISAYFIYHTKGGKIADTASAQFYKLTKK